MAELEASIEEKLIDKLVNGDSQWTRRDDLKTEEDLWKNFRYILEQNNKAKLDDVQLTDQEFEQVKNQLQFATFYDAGKWIVGENGIAQVHVQRGTQTLHLTVLNNEHVAGGSSTYEVINQYRALREEETETKERDRRFDVSLLINGLPLIHIELKNREHSYMDGFWQIKKYIAEGKFRGIFSAVQMFVVSNAVDTRYFSAADSTELNQKFMFGWLDKENKPVPNYLDFAGAVLRIPQAHEIVTKYTVLDQTARKLILLRPYQIHAITAIREASKRGVSGYIWHTTGSGKTMTSYKATRNLLRDIPAIDKTVFLIDRKDLDTQTTQAFQSYANSDVIDVDETDNVTDLEKKLGNTDRQMIVTTIQKMQILVRKKLPGKEETKIYQIIRNLNIAFVVDECHRSVSPQTKRELEGFFARSLWYGFTGTPRFTQNPYPQLGDLPQTTDELYGKCLHQYTIKEAIHDNAVLGFQVEHVGHQDIKKDSEQEDLAIYSDEKHMLQVLDVILNKSNNKLGIQRGKGKTYDAILTTSSIAMAQRYYTLLKNIVAGKTNVVINDEMKKVLPDFPKFAITYSVTEDDEKSGVNQKLMNESLDDYNRMFDTHFEVGQIRSYNKNLNDRFARKNGRYTSRDQQLDLVIVVDRLLTGFDAPCLSTLFIDRQPFQPHDLIQAFSRTNRIFDNNKTFGQIVTFQSPYQFKEAVDKALMLYSAGGIREALAQEWDQVEAEFVRTLSELRYVAETPDKIPGMSLKEKKRFTGRFQKFDREFAQLKAFTNYADKNLADYGITDLEYEEYAAHYKNVMDELKDIDGDDIDKDGKGEIELDENYELMAYIHTKIDYEYIVSLIQDIVSYTDDSEEENEEERQRKLKEVWEYIAELSKENKKLGTLMTELVNNIEKDRDAYKNQRISTILEGMKKQAIRSVVHDFSEKWALKEDAVLYAAENYHNNEIPNITAVMEGSSYSVYRERTEDPLPKLRYRKTFVEELKKLIEEEIVPLQRER